MNLDFEGLASALLGQSEALLSSWLPGGRLVGGEYTCADVRGGHGDSLKANIKTGKWSDFAAGLKGRDLISLYAAIYGMKNGEAFKKLSSEINFDSGHTPEPVVEIEISEPPSNAIPVLTHFQYGSPESSWCYKSEVGKPLFYIARYNPKGQRKVIVPWSWAPSKARFIQKGFPSPRPLYGLELLAENPDMPIMLVEGEKAADAARKFASHVYNVMTWSHGVQSIDKTDWRPIHGRKILLWPDADPAGAAAMQKIGDMLLPVCPEVKILSTEELEKGADAADFDFTWETFVEWAKPRAALYAGSKAVAVPVEIVPKVIAPPKVSVTVAEDQGELPASIASALDELGIATTRTGTPICNMENALRVLENLPAYKEHLWYDEFHCKFFTKGENGPREWQDLDEIALMKFMQRELGMRNMTETMIRTACISFAHQHKRNEPRDWMDSLVWDGNERLDVMFHHYFGAKLSEYMTAASKNWWISMVARAYQPGAKVDSMVILEGEQGQFKSMALGVIGGKWYSEAHESVTNKDFFLLLQGKLIIEISELDAFSKAEVNTIKKVITCQTDRFRPPYGRVSIDYPRRCVFVGTTNEQHYLRDTTGARRFWPVKIGRINIPKLKEDRDQLFAEAVHRFKKDEIWYDMPAETADIQESRRQHDEWETPIGAFIAHRDETTVTEVATECLSILLSKMDIMVQRRISKVLSQLNWESTVIREGERIVRLWKKK